MDSDVATSASRFGKHEPWNKHLPYSDDLEAEAMVQFEDIRRGFAEIVARRDFGPAFRFLCNRLVSHVSLYKYAFSLDDHVKLTSLLLEVFFIDGLDYSYQERIAGVLRRLLRKRAILPSSALVIPWKPFYELLSKLYFGKLRSTVEIHRQHGVAVCKLVRAARRFFAPSATKEIMATLRPLLCPHDETLYRSACFLAMLLPTDPTSPAAAAPEFLGWLDEITHVWTWIENMRDWDLCWVSLLVRVARFNVGKIDWNPMLPWLFTKFLAAFALPVGSERAASPYQHSVPGSVGMLLPTGEGRESKIAMMIVYMIQPENQTLEFLKSFLSAIEPFFHPSNTGPWSTYLGVLIYKLAEWFARRMNDERQPECTTPAEARLTTVECEAFCTTLLPVMHLAMYGKSRHMTSAASYGARHLSFICPDIVIPSFMEKIYTALQTLTETHQTVSAMAVLLNMVRPMMWKAHYKDGAKHLLPILQLCLPGIDPNDAIKTQHALAVYTTIFANVQFIDCSAGPIPADATDEDRQVYADTAMFEDWSFQFLERIFGVLETMVAASNKVHSTERGLGYVLALACRDFFQQLSPALFETAVLKLKAWVMANCLVHVGKSAGAICGAAVRAHPEIALQILLPDLCARVLPLLDDYQSVNEASEEGADDTVDEELLWLLNVLVRLVKYGGAMLLAHRELLMSVLDKVLPIAPYKASKLGGKMFRHLLKSLTTLYPLDTRSLTETQIKEAEGDPVKLFELRGQSIGPYNNLEVRWHKSTTEELAFAEELVARYYTPAIADLKEIAKSGGGGGGGVEADAVAVTATMPDKDKTRVNLMIVRNVVRVGLALMPELDGDASYFDEESKVKMTLPQLALFAKDHAQTAAGQERRKEVCDVMHGLVGFYLEHQEDDIKALKTIIKINKQLLCVRGMPERKYSHSMRSYDAVKRGYEDINHGGKLHYRGLLVSRVWLQHSRRLSKRRISTPFTETYQSLVKDLVLLGVSRYAKVRQHAQTTLFSAMAVFVQAKHFVIPMVLKLTEVPVSEHEDKHQQIKGALHILAHGTVSKALNANWSYLKLYMETIPKLHSTEKQTIQVLVSKAFGSLRQAFRTRSLELTIPDRCFDVAQLLCPSISDLADHFKGIGVTELAAANASRNANFDSLIDSLVGTLNEAKVGWKCGLLLSSSLFALLRDDRDVPVSIAQFYLRNLADDLINVRSMASRAVSIILAIAKKRPLKSRLLCGPSYAEPQFLGADADGPSAAAAAAAAAAPAPGNRVDNTSHTFQSDAAARPQTKEAVESTIYVDKNYIGWNSWPVDMQTYLPKGQQPAHASTEIDTLCEEFFGDAEFVRKWVDFAAQAKSDGSAPPFHDPRAEVFKGIAKNFGGKALKFFQPEVERLLVEDPADGAGEHASKLRCAAEMVAGLVRGAKHWSYNETEELWAWVIPVLRKVLPTLSNLSIGDWSAAIRFCVYDRDPRRFYPLTDLLFELKLTMDENDTSFSQFRRLLFLHTPLEELSWRGVQPALQLLTGLKDYLGHPYKLVREKISRCLFVVMRATWDPSLTAPQKFFALAGAGADGDADAGVANVDATAAAVHPIRAFALEMAATIGANRAPVEDKEVRRTATNLAKTVVQWVTIAFNDGSSTALVPHLDGLLPHLFSLPETDPDDDELGKLTRQALGFAAQAILPKSCMEAYFESVVAVASDPSWHARRRVLLFLQVLTFRNLFVAPIELVQGVVVTLMQDVQLEVRELAGETLGGMIRCGLVKGKKLRKSFIKLAKTEIRQPPKRRRPNDLPPLPLTDAEKAALVRRHAGLLGLDAYLGSAPYTIPKWMPETLLIVCDFVNDPEPIRKTVKKTLGDFWRTHQEDRQAMKDAFGEDNTDMISDLAGGHNYYA